MALDTGGLDGLEGFLLSLNDTAVAIRTFHYICLDAGQVFDTDARFPIKKPSYALMTIPARYLARPFAMVALGAIFQIRFAMFLPGGMAVEALQIHPCVGIVGELDLIEGDGAFF